MVLEHGRSYISWASPAASNAILGFSICLEFAHKVGLTSRLVMAEQTAVRPPGMKLLSRHRLAAAHGAVSIPGQEFRPRRGV